VDGCVVGDDGRYVGGNDDGDDGRTEVVTVGDNDGFVDDDVGYVDGRGDDCDDGRAVGPNDGLAAARKTLWLDSSDSDRKSVDECLIDGPRTHLKTSVQAELMLDKVSEIADIG
jgi:hypothetical protein